MKILQYFSRDSKYLSSIETIEIIEEEIELRGNKINILEKELKDVNHYDEAKINCLLNKKTLLLEKMATNELNDVYSTLFH
jgi:hypothetical protein